MRFLILLLLPFSLLAQLPQLVPPATVPPAPPLSLQQAVTEGLANNFGILLIRQDEQIAGKTT